AGQTEEGHCRCYTGVASDGLLLQHSSVGCGCNRAQRFVSAERRVSMQRERISTTDAPGAIGPYSQAIATGNFVFCSGQVALEPATGLFVEGDVRVQTRRALENLSGVLNAAGSSLAQVVKTTVFLVSMSDF